MPFCDFKFPKRWDIVNVSKKKQTLYGLVIYVYSGKFGKCIVKYVPKESFRFERELEAYKLIPSSILCPLIDYEAEQNLLLLPELSTFDDDFAYSNSSVILINYFLSLQREELLFDNQTLLNIVPYFYMLNKKKYIKIGNNIDDYIQVSINKYQMFFLDEPNYIIHGDMHIKNLGSIVIDNRIQVLAFDPIGYVAPIEFELVRFLGSMGLKNIHEMEKWLDIFSGMYSDVRLIEALYIDCCFRLHNSIFEDTTGKTTKAWLYFLTKYFT